MFAELKSIYDEKKEWASELLTIKQDDGVKDEQGEREIMELDEVEIRERI